MTAQQDITCQSTNCLVRKKFDQVHKKAIFFKELHIKLRTKDVLIKMQNSCNKAMPRSK